MEAIYVSTDRWKDKEDVIYIHGKILLSHKSEVLLFVATWMGLEGIILCDMSLTEKDKCYKTSFICGI